MPNGISEFLLTDSAPLFVSKFFNSIYLYLDTKLLTTKAYISHPNGQTARYNKTTSNRLLHCINECQHDWDAIFQPLIYAYSCQVQRSTNTPPFSLTLTKEPPSAADISLASEIPSDDNRSIPARLLQQRLCFWNASEH